MCENPARPMCPLQKRQWTVRGNKGSRKDTLSDVLVSVFLATQRCLRIVEVHAAQVLEIYSVVECFHCRSSLAREQRAMVLEKHTRFTVKA